MAEAAEQYGDVSYSITEPLGVQKDIITLIHSTIYKKMADDEI